MPVIAHVGGGVFEPLQVCGLTLLGAAYGIRVANLRSRGRPVPTWRICFFFGGLGLILVAFISPLAHIGGELILVHMIQHLAIGDIAALFMVLGLTRSVLRPLMAMKWFERAQVLTLPMVALPLWIANLLIWHLPVLYEGAVTNEAVHALQHMCFIGFGILMWMPIAGPLPVPTWFGGGSQLIYTAFARLAGAGLGNILMWAGTPLYAVYAAGEEYWGISPLADQGAAGVIMTAEGGLVTLAILSWLVLRWAARDAQKQRLLDLAAERGIPLTDARVDRAIAAGHAARLEERLRG